MTLTDKSTDLLKNAAVYYAKIGWAIFPCENNGKKPLVKWKDAATTDEQTILKWWDKWPGANIGLPTGLKNGLFVVDFDRKKDEHGKDGLDYFDDIERRNHTRLRAEVVTITRSVGLHYYFRHFDGVKNTSSKLAYGIDTRGEGGYVIVPPSRVDGLPYFFNSRKPVLRSMLAPVPEWLAKEFAAVSAPVVRTRRPVVINQSDKINPWCYKAFIEEVKGVMMSANGERNHILNRAAYRLGGMCATRHLCAEEVRQELLLAAMQAGLSQVEALHTIESGLKAGYNNPVSPPVREEN